MVKNLIQRLRNSVIAGVVGLSTLASGCSGVIYKVTYDSVPRNARLFSNGRYIGDTPSTFQYRLDLENFPDETSAPTIDCAKEGYIPEKIQLRLKAPNGNGYPDIGGRCADYHHTFFLKSDPNYRPEPQTFAPPSGIFIVPTLIVPFNR